MAGAHALSGAATGLGLALGAAAVGVVGDPRATGVALAVVCAGAALAPDIDHPSSTATRAAGPLSRLAHEVVREVAGEHRRGTHCILGMAVGVVGAGVLLLVPWGLAVLVAALAVPVAVLVARTRVARWAGRVVWTGLVVSRRRRRGRVGRRWARRLALVPCWAAAGALGVGAAGLAAEWGVPLWLVPPAVGAGVVAHLVGDQITDQGICWWWPVQQKPTRLPVSIEAGGLVERWVVVPALVGLVGWLGLVTVL